MLMADEMNDFFTKFDHKNILHKLRSIKLDSFGSTHISLEELTHLLSTVHNQPISLSETAFPQGSILGPMLFTLYFNNTMLQNQYLNVHYFADDTIIYAPGSTQTQALTCLQSAFDTFQSSLIIATN